MITGSFTGPFAQAIYQRLRADATLMALVNDNVMTSLPRASEVPFPYVVVSTTERPKGYRGGAMQREGGLARQVIDVWGDLNDRTEVETIQSRITVLLLRQTLTMPTHIMLHASLDCEEEKRFEDKDPELPQQRSLFHGVQHWIAWLEEAA